MNISIAGFSVHGLVEESKINIFGYLESCRYRYHLDSADIWNGQIGTNDESVLRKVRHEIEERELTLANYHVDGVHLWEDDPDARERNYQNALIELKAAAILGAKTVRFDTGGTFAPMTPEQHDYLATRFGEYCRFAADHGFRVGPENHWGLSQVADNMETLIHDIASPAYGILLHFGNWQLGDKDDGDRRMAPYVMHTHVDAATTFGGKLADKMQMLLDAGYTGYWGVEHHSAKNEYAEVALQLAQVRRVLTRTRWEAQKAESDAVPVRKTLNPLLTPEQEGLV
ncbi:MAG: sugar phosphate isomerase/epimerase [Akkermansiaceae bacterium]|nr:sugar phosphate isomerase/epimerase [Armatimonadota bacterium]